MSELKKEAKRLYDLGFAIHWLHSKSKRPIESGWTTGPRKDWTYLSETYIDGLNVGVRLGTPSKIAGGFLAVIDIDIKSEDRRHLQDAMSALRNLIGSDAYKNCPTVRSGRGNGSRHLYCLTEKPFKTWNPAQSKNTVRVLQPSKKPSKAELKAFSADEIEVGWRLSKAWEISLYSDGRQVVLPPSIHPDTGAMYAWGKRLNRKAELPTFKFPDPPEALIHEKTNRPSTSNILPLENFTLSPVDLSWLPIPNDIKEGIEHGHGVLDRSGFLLRATSSLYNAGLTRDEILTLLTDSHYFIATCSFDHAKTKSRKRAIEWLWKFTVSKVFEERSAEKAFDPKDDGEWGEKRLTDDEVKALDFEVLGFRHWAQNLEKQKNGAIKPTIDNVVMILENVGGPEIIRRNEFAFRDAYGAEPPWGGKIDAALTDDDVAKIRHWLGRHYKFQAGRDVIYDALTSLACAHSFDPVKDYLDALPEWDKVSRLDGWLKKNFCAEGDPIYLAQVFRKWMCAMVIRIYQPGAKFDWMPIFEGAQGVGKSSFGRLLCGDKYFLDWLPNLADKDSALALQGIWVVEMGELSQFRKNEIEVIKAFVTRTVDKVRPPHGRKVIELARRCVFFGTTNREQYLRDDTGNRRFKPVKVGELNFDALREERIQLFAEAKALVDLGIETEQSLDLSGEAKTFETTVQGEKMVEDDASMMAEQMQIWFEKLDEEMKAPFNEKKFQIAELFGQGCPLKGWLPNRRNAQFAGKALRTIGATKWKSDGRIFWKVSERDNFYHQNGELVPTKKTYDFL